MDEVQHHMSLRVRDVPLALPLRLLSERDTCSVYRDGRDSGVLAAAGKAEGEEEEGGEKKKKEEEEEEEEEGGEEDEDEDEDIEGRAAEITAALGLTLSSAALAEV